MDVPVYEEYVYRLNRVSALSEMLIPARLKGGIRRGVLRQSFLLFNFQPVGDRIRYDFSDPAVYPMTSLDPEQ